MSQSISRRTFLKVSGASALATVAAGSVLAWRDRQPTPIRTTAGPLVPTNATTPRVSERASGFMAVAPRVLRAAQANAVSISLFGATGPVRGETTLALLQGDATLATSSGWIDGHGALALNLPPLAPGGYALRVSGNGFAKQVPIEVEDGTIVLIETDKPIYKPGQSVQMRVMTIDGDLRPVAAQVELRVTDGQGITVFKTDVQTDEFGMAHATLPLSSEPNLGVWNVQATLGERSAQSDFRVERYVLPKYEVSINLDQTWALVDDAIYGTLTAEYSFGKPVSGMAEITASRYVGTWEPYATLSLPIVDGQLAFELPPVNYVAGSPDSAGMGRVQLEATVTERETGYSQASTEFVTIADAPVVLTLVPESASFKPGLPLEVLIVTESPAGAPVEATVSYSLTWLDQQYRELERSSGSVSTSSGLGRLALDPPSNAAQMYLEANIDSRAWRVLQLNAGYSPSSTFIHVRQTSAGNAEVGERIQFEVASTREARSFFYEVLARGRVVFSAVSETPDIAIMATPDMAPEARLLVYQVLTNGEVAADSLPFSVQAVFNHQISIDIGTDEAAPGGAVEIAVRTEGPARVGLAAVDRSVFILAENRLNLQQVFAQLEQLTLEPRAELHEAAPVFDFWMPGGSGSGQMPGAATTFADAGVLVITDRDVPEDEAMFRRDMVFAVDRAVPAAAATPASADGQETAQAAPLTEPTRVRQFFPETWLWEQLTTDADGRATVPATVPDSITTWMLRAVALSPEHGLGISEAALRAFQPFFVSVDLPYAVIRGEEVPAAVAVYNYTDRAETFQIDLEPATWFAALGSTTLNVTVEPNNVGAAAFPIRLLDVGSHQLRITARGPHAADAIIKDVRVEPEGVPAELLENVVLPAGSQRTFELALPDGTVPDSERAFVAVVGNMLGQTMNGLEGLLQMSFGCGEQNMVLFAPNVFITRYLDASRQLKPEIRARAEVLMLTGYQRQLTFQRTDGSFSAFGNVDVSGSLWLTAFVLKSFAQAGGVVHIDEQVLTRAADWITTQQQADGSFAPVGFVHHAELLGGLHGNTALTAFVAIALREAGHSAAATRAVDYLASQLERIDDVYALTLTAYALALSDSPAADAAIDRLQESASVDQNGTYWESQPQTLFGTATQPSTPAASIEATAYAALALLAAGQRMAAGNAIRWLTAQRNAQGGFGSTQDTVVALQAITTSAIDAQSDINATVSIELDGNKHELRIDSNNAEVVQLVEIPATGTLTIETIGTGEVMAQIVQRYNMPAVAIVPEQIFDLDVQYDADQIATDNLLEITATVRYTPPRGIGTGMVVLDIGIPTGFAADEASLDRARDADPLLKRWELAGRMVVFYIDDLQPGQELTIAFAARAQYPVSAAGVTSRVYAYYQPDWTTTSLGAAVTVS